VLTGKTENGFRTRVTSQQLKRSEMTSTSEWQQQLGLEILFVIVLSGCDRDLRLRLPANKTESANGRSMRVGPRSVGGMDSIRGRLMNQRKGTNKPRTDLPNDCTFLPSKSPKPSKDRIPVWCGRALTGPISSTISETPKDYSDTRNVFN
jgi:hypothetical protein